MGHTSRFAGAAAISTLPLALGAGIDSHAAVGFGAALSTFWLGAAAVVDRTLQRVPDRLLVLATLPTAIGAAMLTQQGDASAGPKAGCGAIAWALPLFVAHLIAPSDLGFGDVKAAGVGGATLGLTQPLTVIAAGLVGAMAAAVLAARASRRDVVALGPCLAGAVLGCLAVGPIVEGP